MLTPPMITSGASAPAAAALAREAARQMAGEPDPLKRRLLTVLRLGRLMLASLGPKAVGSVLAQLRADTARLPLQTRMAMAGLLAVLPMATAPGLEAAESWAARTSPQTLRAYANCLTQMLSVACNEGLADEEAGAAILAALASMKQETNHTDGQ